MSLIGAISISVPCVAPAPRSPESSSAPGPRRAPCHRIEGVPIRTCDRRHRLAALPRRHPRLAAVAVLFMEHRTRRGGRRPHLHLGQPPAAFADQAIAALRQPRAAPVVTLHRPATRATTFGANPLLHHLHDHTTPCLD